MTQTQTAKQQYDELLAELKAGTHTFNGRSVLAWDAYDLPAGLLRSEATKEDPAVPHPHAGHRVVSIQYAGVQGGDGGLLRDYAFDPAQLAESEPDSEPQKTEKQPRKETHIQ